MASREKAPMAGPIALPPCCMSTTRGSSSGPVPSPPLKPCVARMNSKCPHAQHIRRDGKCDGNTE